MSEHGKLVTSLAPIETCQRRLRSSQSPLGTGPINTLLFLF
ncbi:MAG: hypothetical protein ACTSRA_10440 [Promethearchaeota archaeon]